MELSALKEIWFGIFTRSSFDNGTYIAKYGLGLGEGAGKLSSIK